MIPPVGMLSIDFGARRYLPIGNGVDPRRVGSLISTVTCRVYGTLERALT